tara:strand:- start:1285 stop:1845 length:561 start_codon:yes stop_codon:yes gene_type:complete
MNPIPSQPQLSGLQKTSLVLGALLLSILLFLFQGGLDKTKTLDYLARNSLDPEIALSNGNPTLIEFYADWCEICKEMAPIMLEMKKDYKEQINMVFLNVDNAKWDDFVEEYDVNGIPQLNLFDNNGLLKGKSVGSKSRSQIVNLLNTLITSQDFSQNEDLVNKGINSSLQTYQSTQRDVAISPMTH